MSLKSNNSSMKNKIVEKAKEKAFLEYYEDISLKNKSLQLFLESISTDGELVLFIYLVISINKVNNNTITKK